VPGIAALATSGIGAGLDALAARFGPGLRAWKSAITTGLAPETSVAERQIASDIASAQMKRFPENPSQVPKYALYGGLGTVEDTDLANYPMYYNSNLPAEPAAWWASWSET
jgi:hypothetical protein